MAIKKEKKLKLELKKREKIALQTAIARTKLLRELIEKKKRVNVLARVEDKIPNVLVKRRDEEIKPTFLGKGGLI